jgi:hypothetical protein
MIKKFLVSFFICLTMVSFANAQDGPNLKNGLWEITSKTRIPGMPMTPATHTQCLTSQDYLPKDMLQVRSACKIVDQKVSGNTVSWTVKCHGGGDTGTGKGEVTYSGESFKGAFVLNVHGMETISQMTGKYVGPCEK